MTYDATDTDADGTVEADVDNETTTTDELNGAVTSNLSVGKIFGARIESQSPSGVSAAEFTSGISTDYHRYVFELIDLVPSSDGTNLALEVSKDGGSSWQTGASDYRFALQAVTDGGSGTTSGNTGANYQVHGGQGVNVGSAAGESVMGTVVLSHPANTSEKLLIYTDTIGFHNDGTVRRQQGGGAYTTAEAIDGVRILFGSGNIESGEIDLYGVMG